MSSLNTILKSHKIIETDVGAFEFIQALDGGEGGNSFVFKFKKGTNFFAIKFLKPSETNSTKIARMVDEYFCSSLIKQHENIAHNYHFDKIKLNGYIYHIIVMKLYDQTLKNLGTIEDEPIESKVIRSWHLFNDLCSGLQHLHNNGIVHRDIKPENIFYSKENNKFIIGDLGIAKFADDFPKEAISTNGERLANYQYGAPEQYDKKLFNTVSFPSDIYALGKVLEWYLTGSVRRGLGSNIITSPNDPLEFSILNKILNSCMQDNLDRRYKNISEIKEHIANLRKEAIPKKPSLFQTFTNFDKLIRQTCPRIHNIEEISDQTKILKFINNFNNISYDYFWYMDADEGDNKYNHIKKYDDVLIFNSYIEIVIDKLIIYRHPSKSYLSFFILLTKPMKQFETVDNQGNLINRGQINYSSDVAEYYIDHEVYIEEKETRLGYYELSDGTTISTMDKFSTRRRQLIPYAYIFVFNGTATSRTIDRSPTGDFLKQVLIDRSLTKPNLDNFLKRTNGHYAPSLSQYD